MKKIYIAGGTIICFLSMILILYVVNYGKKIDENDQLDRKVISLQYEVDRYSRYCDTIPVFESTTTKNKTAAETKPEITTTTRTGDVSLYEDKLVSICFVRCQRAELYNNEIVFKVKNKTDKTLTIQNESMSLDGISISSSKTIMSDEVAPKSEGFVYLKIDESINLSPSKISGELRVVDFSTHESYKAKFVNVGLK